MQLFRHSVDLSQAQVRPANETDLFALMHLLRESGRRYYGLKGNDMPRLLGSTPATVIEQRGRLHGLALPGWSTHHSVWLRCVALARGIEVKEGLRMLLPPLHDMLRTTGLRYIFYAGDEDTDSWLLPALRQTGYTIDTTVVVYEKHDFSVPGEGNTQIVLRPARADDLPALFELDTLCFEAHWTKDETLLHEALTERGLFVVAQADEQIVGYAYATTHFGGRLVHLVRIAVHPQQRRHGIGARLLAAVVHYSREQQADLITLNTQSYNERAQQLYRWFGFVRNGEYQTVLRHNL